MSLTLINILLDYDLFEGWGLCSLLLTVISSEFGSWSVINKSLLKKKIGNYEMLIEGGEKRGINTPKQTSPFNFIVYFILFCFKQRQLLRLQV